MSCTWLTVKEAADFLKINPNTMHRYIREGRLLANRPGGRIIRICLEVLNDMDAPPRCKVCNKAFKLNSEGLCSDCNWLKQRSA